MNLHFEQFYNHDRLFDLLDKISIKPWYWISIAGALLAADFLSGPFLHVSEALFSHSICPDCMQTV